MGGDDSGQTTPWERGPPFPVSPAGKPNNTMTNKEEEVTP